MKTFLLLALVIFAYTLISCSKKEVAVKSSKDTYKDVLFDIAEISYISSTDMLSDMTTDFSIKNAELDGDTLLVKIYKAEKEKLSLVRKEKLNKLLLLQAKQDSLLKNDTVLISRGIRKTDDCFSIETKFEYYETNKRAKKSLVKYVVESDMGCEAYFRALKVQNKQATANTNWYMNTQFYSF